MTNKQTNVLTEHSYSNAVEPSYQQNQILTEATNNNNNISRNAAQNSMLSRYLIQQQCLFILKQSQEGMN